jgi:hypothetical protein
MSSELRVDNLSDGTNTRDMAAIYTGSAKVVGIYDTLGGAPYSASVQYSFGVSSVIDIQTGIAEFVPTNRIDIRLNRRPVLCSTSTDYTVTNFGYNGAFYTGSAYRISYYTSNWAAGIVSCNGY